jgi:NodT family efflux transporter outer membrane factor (OMF) lipoprotein
MGRSGSWLAGPSVVLGLALLVAGCSLVPAYHRPDPPIPPAWATTGAAAGLHNAVPARGAWWKSFASSELAALENRGLTGSYNLQAAIARIEEAGGTAQVAGAPLYPSLDLGAIIDRSHGNSNGGSGNGSSGNGSSGTQNLFAFASYEIDFWGKNHAVANSANALAVATKFDEKTVALTLTASIADVYFQILSLQERVRLAEQIADSARHILALIEIQAANGVASDLQVQQQRNQVATFDAAVPVLRQQLDQDTHLLAVLAGGTPEGFSVSGKGLDGVLVPTVQSDLPATVLRNRPDIQAAEARLISANFDVGAARAAFYPNITLTGQGGLASDSLSHFSSVTAFADIAANLTQPIFEGGRLEGQLTFDRAHTVELAAAYRQTVITAFQDVEDALTAVAHLQELEALDQVAVDSARRAYDLADAQFRFGAIDFLTVLTTERSLYQAQDALLQVHLLRLEAVVALFRALGGGFDPAPGGSPPLSAHAADTTAGTTKMASER